MRLPGSSAGDALRFPQPQEAVLAVGSDQILVWVMGDANDVFLMNLEVERTQRSTHCVRLCLHLLPALSILNKNISLWRLLECGSYSQRFLQPSRLVVEAVQH